MSGRVGHVKPWRPRARRRETANFSESHEIHATVFRVIRSFADAATADVEIVDCHDGEGRR